jgi:spore maturation protein CgeB
MRILYAMGNFRGDVDLSMEPNCWIDRDMHPALVELGHDVVRFDWALPSHLVLHGWLKENIDAKNREILELARKTHAEKKVDIFLSAADARYLKAETVRAIKAMGMLTVNYHCDDVNAFHLNDKMAKEYDWNWTIQPAAIANYERAGAHYAYTPCGANPNLYKPHVVEKKYDVTFVGRNMGYRDEMMQHLMNNGIDARVWGEDWPHGLKSMLRRWAAVVKRVGKRPLGKDLGISLWYLAHYGDTKRRFSPLIRFEDMIRLYSQSRVNLNFSGGMGPGMYDFEKAIRSIKLRDIEVPMSGGFYLTEKTKEIEQLFEAGKEIECYSSKAELLEKARHYLAHPDEAERISKAGREKCLREYTWKRNFERLFKEIGAA